MLIVNQGSIDWKNFRIILFLLHSLVYLFRKKFDQKYWKNVRQSAKLVIRHAWGINKTKAEKKVKRKTYQQVQR